MRILYIDIDSLRPDHLGCYGYHRNTSPAIDALAAEGVTFDRAYTSDAPCLPSRTAFYSGRFGIHTGVVGHGGTAAQPKIQGAGRGFRDSFDDQGLAGSLKRLGYHTAMISPFGQRHAAWHFYAGFKEIHNTGQYGMESGEVVQAVVDDWMEKNASGDNWYLHVNYWDPHTPYRYPSDLENPFADSPLPEWLDDDERIRRHNQLVGPHTSLDIAMYSGDRLKKFPRQPGEIRDRSSMKEMIDGYDMGVLYADQQVGRVVASLKEAGVYEDTMIIISADHGENQGELGIYGEHGTADETTCRVPLIIKYPGGAQGVRNNRFQYSVDLSPTLMDLLGGPHQDLWDGTSFAPAITKGENVGRDEVVISQCAHVCQRSVRWENWLYIHTYHDGFHLFPREMVFDLDHDPHEQDDLGEKRPDLCREGQWRLARWHDEQMEKMARTSGDVVDPLWTVIKEGGPFHARLVAPGQPGGLAEFERYLKRLEDTGRAEGAALLRQKYAATIEHFHPS